MLTGERTEGRSGQSKEFSSLASVRGFHTSRPRWGPFTAQPGDGSDSSRCSWDLGLRAKVTSPLQPIRLPGALAVAQEPPSPHTTSHTPQLTPTPHTSHPTAYTHTPACPILAVCRQKCRWCWASSRETWASKGSWLQVEGLAHSPALPLEQGGCGRSGDRWACKEGAYPGPPMPTANTWASDHVHFCPFSLTSSWVMFGCNVPFFTPARSLKNIHSTSFL